MVLATLAWVALLMPQMPSDAGDGPAPSSVEVSWQLKFEFISTPMRVTVGGETYWYILYRVTNPGPRTQTFFPLCTVVSEDLKTVPTEIGVPASVFQEIYKRHRDRFPRLVSPNQVIGELRVGEDYAQESVAIWRNVDLSSNNFAIYVAGLSGETQQIRNPAYNPDEPETKEIVRGGRKETVVVNPRFYTIRKTLEMRYILPGSASGAGMGEPVRVETRWVMR
jgi:hypothetical protein